MQSDGGWRASSGGGTSNRSFAVKSAVAGDAGAGAGHARAVPSAHAAGQCTRGGGHPPQSPQYGTSSQQFWFHVLCLDFVRATGFWVEKPQASQDFLMYALMEASPHSQAYRRGTVVLLLWMLMT